MSVTLIFLNFFNEYSNIPINITVSKTINEIVFSRE